MLSMTSVEACAQDPRLLLLQQGSHRCLQAGACMCLQHVPATALSAACRAPGHCRQGLRCRQGLCCRGSPRQGRHRCIRRLWRRGAPSQQGPGSRPRREVSCSPAVRTDCWHTACRVTFPHGVRQPCCCEGCWQMEIAQHLPPQGEQGAPCLGGVDAWEAPAGRQRHVKHS